MTPGNGNNNSTIRIETVNIDLPYLLLVAGVICASCGAGLGEVTFLSLTAFYNM